MGFYYPREPVTVAEYHIEGLGLAPYPHVVWDSGGGQGAPEACSERLVVRDTLHLLCEVPAIGTVTIDGRFLVTRVAGGIVVKRVRGENGAEVDVLDALVKVSRGGETLYSKRQRFAYGHEE